MSTPRYKPGQVAKALETVKGKVFLAAKSLGCTAQTVRNYMDRYPKVREAAEQSRGELIDKAEEVMWNKIDEGDFDAAKFVLETLGKSRGYVKRVELEEVPPAEARAEIMGCISEALGGEDGTGEAGAAAGDQEATKIRTLAEESGLLPQ